MDRPAFRRRADAQWHNVGTFSLLTMAVVLAWITRSGWRIPGLRWIYRMSRYEAFHIAAHLGVFAAVGFWAGRRGNERSVWLWALAGGIAIELAQWLAGGTPLTLAIVAASLFDVLVNLVGAGLGLAARKSLETPLSRTRT